MKNCQRCNRGMARWFVTSDVIRVEVCIECALDAREMQPYGRPQLPGDLTIEPMEDEK